MEGRIARQPCTNCSMKGAETNRSSTVKTAKPPNPLSDACRSPAAPLFRGGSHVAFLFRQYAREDRRALREDRQPGPRSWMMTSARMFASTSGACRKANLPSRISLTEPVPSRNFSAATPFASAFSRGFHRRLIDIHPQCHPCPQLQRCNGQDPRHRSRTSMTGVRGTFPPPPGSPALPGITVSSGVSPSRMPSPGRSGSGSASRPAISAMPAR